MFTPADREGVLADLITAARADPGITAAARVGSAARGEEDDWSDIDLALRLAPGISPADAVGIWTARMHDRHGCVDHLDVWSGSALYRVFLLENTLQVDLSLWPDADFRARGPFVLIFGSAPHGDVADRPDPLPLVRMGWLYALHVRSALARGRWWQAVQMLDAVREQIITLCCLRHDLPAYEGRGVDRLPSDLLGRIAATRSPDLHHASLIGAFRAAVELLLDELDLVDGPQAKRIRPTLLALTDPP